MNRRLPVDRAGRTAASIRGRPACGSLSRIPEDRRGRITTLELALETGGLRRTFGDLVAVDGIDLAVPGGSFYGFLGPNGAGTIFLTSHILEIVE
ncbi:MAG: hypothetical protein ACE5HD_12840 [Acidobacteriota bacterium]